MADINKNSTITGQYYSTAGGPLDAKLTPAGVYEDIASKSGLTRIPLTHRYEGLTVTVLNNGHPVDFWLVGGRSNACWKVKTGNIVGTKQELLSLSSSACTIGLEMVVQEDETNDGKLTKYWVTEIDGGNVTWEKKEYGANVTVDGEDIESNE